MSQLSCCNHSVHSKPDSSRLFHFVFRGYSAKPPCLSWKRIATNFCSFFFFPIYLFTSTPPFLWHYRPSFLPWVMPADWWSLFCFNYIAGVAARSLHTREAENPTRLRLWIEFVKVETVNIFTLLVCLPLSFPHPVWLFVYTLYISLAGLCFIFLSSDTSEAAMTHSMTGSWNVNGVNSFWISAFFFL